MTIKGGEKLKAKLEEMAHKIANAKAVEIGFLSGSNYPVDQGGLPVAFIAAQNEYGGTITIPEHETTINRNVDKEGNFLNGGKFTKEKSANLQTSHIVPEHTINIPPRPFFRNMISDHKDDWGDVISKIAKNNNVNLKKRDGSIKTKEDLFKSLQRKKLV
jgi:hypothetical protein